MCSPEHNDVDQDMLWISSDPTIPGLCEFIKAVQASSVTSEQSLDTGISSFQFFKTVGEDPVDVL